MERVQGENGIVYLRLSPDADPWMPQWMAGFAPFTGRGWVFETYWSSNGCTRVAEPVDPPCYVRGEFWYEVVHPLGLLPVAYPSLDAEPADDAVASPLGSMVRATEKFTPPGADITYVRLAPGGGGSGGGSDANEEAGGGYIFEDAEYAPHEMMMVDGVSIVRPIDSPFRVSQAGEDDGPDTDRSDDGASAAAAAAGGDDAALSSPAPQQRGISLWRVAATPGAMAIGAPSLDPIVAWECEDIFLGTGALVVAEAVRTIHGDPRRGAVTYLRLARDAPTFDAPQAPTTGWWLVARKGAFAPAIALAGPEWSVQRGRWNHRAEADMPLYAAPAADPSAAPRAPSRAVLPAGAVLEARLRIERSGGDDAAVLLGGAEGWVFLS